MPRIAAKVHTSNTLLRHPVQLIYSQKKRKRNAKKTQNVFTKLTSARKAAPELRHTSEARSARAKPKRGLQCALEECAAPQERGGIVCNVGLVIQPVDPKGFQLSFVSVVGF